MCRKKAAVKLNFEGSQLVAPATSVCGASDFTMASKRAEQAIR